MPQSPQGTTATVHTDRAPLPEVESAFEQASAAWAESIPESEREEKPATAVPAAPSVEQPKEEKAPPLSKAAAAMYRREAEVRKKEAELSQRIKDLEARVAAAPKPPEKPPINPRLDPEEFLRSQGLDPVAVSRFVLSKQLGDKAPPEILAQRAAYEREAQTTANYDGRFNEVLTKLDRVEQENAQFRLMLQAREAQKTFHAEVESFKPNEAEAPHAAELYTSDPDYFRAEVVEEIRRDAALRIHTEGAAAEAITPAEAVKRIDSRIAKYGGRGTSSSKNDPNLAGKKASAAKTRAPQRVDEQTPSPDPIDDVWSSAAQGFLTAP